MQTNIYTFNTLMFALPTTVLVINLATRFSFSVYNWKRCFVKMTQTYSKLDDVEMNGETFVYERGKL